MIFSALEPRLRTVSVDLSLLLRMTMPSQRACFAAFFSAFSWAGVSLASSFLEPSCANTGIDSEKTSTDVNNRASSFLSMYLLFSQQNLGAAGTPAEGVGCASKLCAPPSSEV